MIFIQPRVQPRFLGTGRHIPKFLFASLKVKARSKAGTLTHIYTDTHGSSSVTNKETN